MLLAKIQKLNFTAFKLMYLFSINYKLFSEISLNSLFINPKPFYICTANRFYVLLNLNYNIKKPSQHGI